MSIKLSGTLHNYQPFRDLWEVTYIPLNIRYDGQISQRRLIPFPDGTPTKDWNLTEATPECYKICADRGVYSSLPFNFGPSLLKDLWINARDVYDKIIDSEKKSSDRFKGHSNAIAQASPNHAILPLMREDKELHVKWSINEYKKHFNKDPEGMWLPEAAVDEETLTILASYKIKYVILAPKQAKSFKKIGTNDWQDTGWDGRNIDTSKSYKVCFEKEKYRDKNIVIFFYDSEFSGDIAFPNHETKWIYDSSENFLHRWLNTSGNFKHFAVDGETFGLHHKGKAHLLAGAVHLINNSPNNWGGAYFTNYGLYLENNPPEVEVKIYENTAWSCNHNLIHWGEERFIEKEHNKHKWLEQAHCDCMGGSHEWRVPMKKAFDDLAERIDHIYFRYGGKYLKDPQNALLDYGKVTSSSQSFCDWFLIHGKEGLSRKETEEAYMLLEMEKFKSYMFTSCGWFWEGVGRPEPFANFLCANTAIKIAKYFKPNSTIEEGFKALLPKNPRFKDEFLRIYFQAKELNRNLLKEANIAYI